MLGRAEEALREGVAFPKYGCLGVHPHVRQNCRSIQFLWKNGGFRKVAVDGT